LFSGVLYVCACVLRTSRRMAHILDQSLITELQIIPDNYGHT